MATIWQPDYQWAAGQNNVVGYQVVQSVVPLYQRKPLIIQSRGLFEDGEIFEDAFGTLSIMGKMRFRWLCPVMGINQYNYIRSTYTPGGTGYYALMTVRTRNSADTFANYSVTTQLPQPHTLERKQDSYKNVYLTFVVQAAL